jgi:hypothetical protein
MEVPMAFLFLFFSVALSLCVVGLIVIGLAAVLGSLRDYWELKKPRVPRPGDYWDPARWPRLTARRREAAFCHISFVPLPGSNKSIAQSATIICRGTSDANYVALSDSDLSGL